MLRERGLRKIDPRFDVNKFRSDPKMILGGNNFPSFVEKQRVMRPNQKVQTVSALLSLH